MSEAQEPLKETRGGAFVCTPPKPAGGGNCVYTMMFAYHMFTVTAPEGQAEVGDILPVSLVWHGNDAVHVLQPAPQEPAE